MSDWPDGLKTAPIGTWPGELTPAHKRRRSAFERPGRWENGKRIPKSAMPLSDTLTILRRELRELGAKEIEMLIAIPAGRFRRDGKPYADAKPEHPGVILSFESRHGHLSYPCDTFTTWQDNLRAVALALEALRKVDRYGVTSHGEQYRGFLALEATAMPGGFPTVDDALAFLGNYISLGVAEMRVIAGAPARALRRAQRETHPDQGGEPALFQRVSLAEAKLREEGLL